MTAIAEAIFDLVLCAMIVSVAFLAGHVRDRFAAVVLFIVYGVFIGLGWLRLQAIDVALAEVALGAGLTGFLLVGANAKLPQSPAPPPGRSARFLAAAGAGTLTLGLTWAFLTLPASEGLRAPVEERLDIAGASNPVTAVLLNFRGWDTLLESVVLVASLLGVWLISSEEAWGERPGLRQHARPEGVLATFARLLPPVGLLIGIYLVWAGSSRPGGAFQGGTVLAAVAILMVLGGLVPAPRIASRRVRGLLIAGPMTFLGVGLVGAIAGTFMNLPPEIAKALILGIEAALTVSIATTLALLVIGPPVHPGPSA